MGSEELWDISNLVAQIKVCPQTYKTLLKENYRDGTCQLMARTKLNKLVKEGDICKVSIPGTRFGESLFYALPKEYKILVEAGRMGSRLYFFSDYKRLNNFFIEVKQYWELKDNEWVKGYNKRFFDGKVLLLL
jgi:hypothetical protein